MTETAIVIVAPDGSHYTGPLCERCGVEPVAREVDAYGKQPQKARLGLVCLAEWWPVRDRTAILMRTARPDAWFSEDLFAQMLRTMAGGGSQVKMDEILRRLARQAERAKAAEQFRRRKG